MQALHKSKSVWGLLALTGVILTPVGVVRRVERQLNLIAGED